jgi:hypothetical protein
MKELWRLWAKAIGEKADEDDREADKIALIRTVIFLHVLLTNAAIFWNIILLRLGM